MILSLALSVAIAEEFRFGGHTSRAEFNLAMQQIQEGQSKQDVERILGTPDDILDKRDGSRIVSSNAFEVWAYGTDGHATLPTLGTVVFKEGKAVLQYGDKAPALPKRMSERELRWALRKLHRYPYMDQITEGYSPNNQHDPLRFIQVVNDLQPMGTQKALAVLLVYDSLTGIPSEGGLFWIVRGLFVSKKKGEVIRLPMIGAIFPDPPNDLKSWPQFPRSRGEGFPIQFLSRRHDSRCPGGICRIREK